MSVKSNSFHDFNEAIYNNDIQSMIENVHLISFEDREFGFHLACSNDRLEIVKYLIDNKLLNNTFSNCYSILRNAYISSFPDSIEVREYVLVQEGYIPDNDDFQWLLENEISVDKTTLKLAKKAGWSLKKSKKH